MRVYRGIIIAILFTLACGVGTAYLIREMLTAKDAFRVAQEASADLETRAQRADVLEERWKKVAPKAEIIDEAFLGRDSIQKFFEAVEATAASAGVTETTSIVRKSGKEDAAAADVTFRLHAGGQFPQLFVFVTHLNVLPTLLFLESVSFSETGGGQAGGQTSGSSIPSVDVVVRVPLKGAEAPVPVPAPASSGSSEEDGSLEE